MPFGAHMSIAGGFPKAVERLIDVGGRALQVFTKSPKLWKGRDVPDEEIEGFRTALKDHDIPPHHVIAHSIYLLNLGSPEDEQWEKSINGLVQELHMCDRLGIPGLVVHPGAHKGEGEAYGVERIAAGLDAAFEKAQDAECQVLLETTAGQGSALGYKFEHLRDILDKADCADRLRVCFDTCHLHAAGYDITTEQAWNATMEEFDRIVGLDRVKAIHMNDSKHDQGSRRDRHDGIGLGTIGLEGFRAIVNDARFSDHCIVLETPKEDEMDQKNLETLQGLRHSKG